MHEPTESLPSESIRLSDDAYAQGRQMAPGWDIYLLEQEWREWITEPPRDANAAFVGFCRKWYERRGMPA